MSINPLWPSINNKHSKQCRLTVFSVLLFRKKKKKRKRIKAQKSDDSSDEYDEDGVKKKGRKNIRKVIKSRDLDDETKEAARTEQERKKRIEERQKMVSSLCASLTTVN